MSLLNINQFAQVPVRGMLDQQIAHGGIYAGAVSANNGGNPILAGDFVDLDPAITAVGQPQFISAAYTDVNFGNSIFDVKSADVYAPNTIQVAGRQIGPVMWLVAGGTINPGQFVEQYNGTTYDVVVYGTSSSKLRGQALDPGSAGNLMRVILVGGTGYGA